MKPLLIFFGQNRAKIGFKRGQKHKITYYEAKWDSKVPKMNSWVVKMVCYLNKLARSIFLTADRLLKQFKGQKIAKIGQKEGQKYKIAYCEAKWDSDVPKLYS